MYVMIDKGANNFDLPDLIKIVVQTKDGRHHTQREHRRRRSDRPLGQHGRIRLHISRHRPGGRQRGAYDEPQRYVLGRRTRHVKMTST